MDLYNYITIDDDFDLQQQTPFFDTIRCFGFSIEFLREKFKSFETEEDALKYLISHKELLTSIISDLHRHSKNKFSKNSTENKRIDTILSAVKEKHITANVKSIEHEFKFYLTWIEKLISKMKISTEFKKQTVWDDVKKVSLKDSDEQLYKHITEINKKILLFRQNDLSFIRKKIVEEVIKLYDSNYKDMYKVKKDFFKLVYPELDIPIKWNLKAFVKYAESLA